jgi:hypothetical protein
VTTTTKQETTTTLGGEGSTTSTTLALACRTARFWGTHVGATGGLIGGAGGCFEVCGEALTNVGLSNASSALEALCVPPLGNTRLQLARQLTALALNCAASGLGSDCGGDADLAELLTTCNGVCATKGGGRSIGSCLREIKCLNGGGVPGAKGCAKGENSCRDVDLPPSVGIDDSDKAKQCHAAVDSGCTIGGSGESKCTEPGTEACD